MVSGCLKTTKRTNIMTININFIHGWGVNYHIFDYFQTLLPADWYTTATPLLGHDNSPTIEHFSVAQAAEHMAKHIKQPTYLFGWSLGGVVALYLAYHYPEKVKGLILCCSFAKLLAEANYPAGLKQTTLHKIAPLFEQDYPKYMRQFLELQLLNNPHAHQILQIVLHDVLKLGTPTALRAALTEVEHIDARSWLHNIHQPTLLIFGEKDAITPPKMGEYLAQHLPNAQLNLITQASHTPFLSHADEVIKLMKKWIQSN